jgi:hypothetical protein
MASLLDPGQSWLPCGRIGKPGRARHPTSPNPHDREGHWIWHVFTCILCVLNTTPLPSASVRRTIYKTLKSRECER